MRFKVTKVCYLTHKNRKVKHIGVKIAEPTNWSNGRQRNSPITHKYQRSNLRPTRQICNNTRSFPNLPSFYFGTRSASFVLSACLFVSRLSSTSQVSFCKTRCKATEYIHILLLFKNCHHQFQRMGPANFWSGNSTRGSTRQESGSTKWHLPACQTGNVRVLWRLVVLELRQYRQEGRYYGINKYTMINVTAIMTGWERCAVWRTLKFESTSSRSKSTDPKMEIKE
jgi:hypothetical protein